MAASTPDTGWKDKRAPLFGAGARAAGATRLASGRNGGKGDVRTVAQVAMVALVAMVAMVGGWVMVFPGLARAQALVADVSHHLIAITLGFTGAEVVLFGAVDGPGDVAVVITGPKGPVSVRRKDRLGGIWINNEGVRFEQVPGYYLVATSRAFAGLVGRTILARHGIGLEYLTFRPDRPMTPALADEFHGALIRNMGRLGLYRMNEGAVAFVGERLFRTNVFFPHNVPTGIYTVTVFLIRDGDIISAQTTPLAVSKDGTSAGIFELAQRQPFLYGWMAVLGALLVGWGAGALIGKE